MDRLGAGESTSEGLLFQDAIAAPGPKDANISFNTKSGRRPFRYISSCLSSAACSGRCSLPTLNSSPMYLTLKPDSYQFWSYTALPRYHVPADLSYIWEAPPYHVNNDRHGLDSPVKPNVSFVWMSTGNAF
jgi:hypothetical protein